jgi:hypothetical protein
LSDLARPGALPLRPLTTGELLDAAVVLLRTRAARLIWLGVVLAVLEQAALFPLRRLADQDITTLPGSGKLLEFGVLVVVGFATEAFCIAVLGGVAATHAPRALLGPAAPQRPPLRLPAVLVVATVAGVVAAIGATPFLVLLPPLQSLGIATAVFPDRVAVAHPVRSGGPGRARGRDRPVRAGPRAAPLGPPRLAGRAAGGLDPGARLHRLAVRPVRPDRGHAGHHRLRVHLTVIHSGTI